MKKISILSACLLAATTMSAQQAVVKDAERAMKSGADVSEVVKIITPAFTDPETANQATTWYIPGKTAFKNYDDLLAKKAFNQLPENGAATMAHDLLDGYEYFTKALPLDSLPDEKGKIKPKYSKDIRNTLAGHFQDYNNAAVDLWGVKEFDNAYKAWDIYLSLAEDPTYAKAINVPADTLLGEIIYNQALAAWQSDKFDLALQAFLKAKDKGYNKKQLYDYAIAVGVAAKNDDAVFELAKEAQPLYGSEDPNYIGYMINNYVNNKDYDKAFSTIDEAIAANPTNAQYYVIKGILFEQKENREEAKAAYKKALEIDQYNSSALYSYGKALCEDAYALSDQAPVNPKEAENYFNTKIRPVFVEAADYLENAYNVNEDNTDALRYLENVYYNLKDEKKLEDVQKRLGK
jgi:tetratricopeptide (TPR) repeat protein